MVPHVKAKAVYIPLKASVRANSGEEQALQSTAKRAFAAGPTARPFLYALNGVGSYRVPTFGHDVVTLWDSPIVRAPLVLAHTYRTVDQLQDGGLTTVQQRQKWLILGSDVVSLSF